MSDVPPYPTSHASRGRLYFAAAALLFAAVPVTTLSVGEGEKQVAALGDDEQNRELRNQSAIAVILGEFRANISDLIFIKTERYLHNGIAMMPHLDMGEMARSGTIQRQGNSSQEEADADEHKGHDHSSHGHEGHDHDSHGHEGHDHGGHVETVIKSAEEDFRGFVGNLEREVKPWQPPGTPDKHTSGTELLPWYRMATLGNPHNERAYMVGAWWLKGMGSAAQVEEALQFISEGISNNPKSFQLELMRGYLLRQLDRDEEALASFRRASELFITVRPPEGKTGPKWTDTQEEQGVAAMTMALFSLRDMRSSRDALELAKQFEARMGALPPAVHRIKADLQRLAAEEQQQ